MDTLGAGPGHEPLAVLGSILLASFASFVALDLARRVHTPDRRVARFWWACGSFAMGTGIWAMHFVGMLGLNLGFPLGYRTATTLASWVAAIVASGIALRIACNEHLKPATWALGAFSMAGGICAMHYIGMAALELQPGIEWHVPLVLLSALVALVASAAALGLFFWMRRFSGRKARGLQLAAAAVMGLAISGMHYTGMAAAGFVEGAVCLSAGALGGPGLGWMVGGAAAAMLTVTMLTSLYDTRMLAREASLSNSLQTANAQLQTANEALKRLAFQDALTTLPNRMLFEDRLEQAAARLDRAPRRSPSQPSRLALLFIDLDGFKPVNDSYGHAAGDQVLQEVAGRLRSLARHSDTVARIGGDEFVVLVEGLASPVDAAATAQRLLAAIQQPMTLGEREIGISCSIGIALYPDQPACHRLLASADAAMYTVKRGGGGNYAFFEAGMSADVGDQMALQQQLRHAIARNELHLQYQPKLVTATGQVSGVEALLRWQHPERGLVPPAEFIPVAERFGLIVALGNWVIERACEQLARWNREGRCMRVAINLSAYQLRQADLVARIAGALDQHGVAPRQLVCEITETVAMEDTALTQQVLGGLAGVGVIISIDDFGTGYSSLAYLRQLRARQLKIDRSFVKDLGDSEDARAVVDAVIRLAHALSLEVVAEGVETEVQHRLLEGMGCDLVQGFLHARPMKPEALLAWLDERVGAHAVEA